MKDRLVITGMGAVTPVGIGVDNYWNGLLSCASGIGPITAFDASRLPVRIAGEIRDIDSLRPMPKALARSAAPFMRYAFAAGQEALEQAGLTAFSDPTAIGICMGTAMAGVAEIHQRTEDYLSSHTGKVSPHFVPRAIGNMAAALLAIHYGIRGPGLTLATACSAGNDALMSAAMLLRLKEAQAVLVVGAESILCPTVISSLAQARALSRRNDSPKTASRPFNLDRDGFVIGEGAGAVVIETIGHAKKRGATPLAIFSGWANTMDGWHITAPEPDGAGATRCMRAALERAGMPPSKIDYINAHGTATPLGDVAETRALKDVFGEKVPPVSSTKGATGHLMGAGGLTEAIACIKSMETGLLPPTLNLLNPDPQCDLDYVPNLPRKARINAAMSNSMGFGGQNSTIILVKPSSMEMQDAAHI